MGHHRPATTAKTWSAIPPQPAPEQLQKAADGPAGATADDDVPPTLPTTPETAAQPILPTAQTTVAVDDQAVGLREAHEHHLPEITSPH
ncbi:hypothetical protein ABZ725_49925 [Streptomyces sp. NPDC006872]|uniref:hypothetical protein n=1 Tax=Streptomyces sp. NPDC006872 TaxID=3155720 RepID=UPI0033DA2499